MLSASKSSHTASLSTEEAVAELSFILSRLQDTVLHPTPERQRLLRRSEIERIKFATNLDKISSTLSRLEQSAAAAPFKPNYSHTLAEQREILELLFDRLKDLRQMAADDEENGDGDDDSSDGEDLLGGVIQTPSQSAGSTAEETDAQHTPPGVDTESESPFAQKLATSLPPGPAPPTPPPAATQTPADPATLPPPPPPSMSAMDPTQTTQTLRSRHAAAAVVSAPSPAPSPPVSHASARAALFASRRKPTAVEAAASTATTEAILEQQRAEQDALAESMLRMAGALKASSHRFSSTLEADKEALGRAGESMSRTEQSMDAARGRMGALRRMTEGKGWWGRMLLYAWVYGLMVVLVLFVFVFPKLRF